MISVYYPYEFEAHENLSHKQFLIWVYYFMDYAVYLHGFSLDLFSGKRAWWRSRIGTPEYIDFPELTSIMELKSRGF